MTSQVELAPLFSLLKLPLEVPQESFEAYREAARAHLFMPRKASLVARLFFLSSFDAPPSRPRRTILLSRHKNKLEECDCFGLVRLASLEIKVFSCFSKLAIHLVFLKGEQPALAQFLASHIKLKIVRDYLTQADLSSDAILKISNELTAAKRFVRKGTMSNSCSKELRDYMAGY